MQQDLLPLFPLEVVLFPRTLCPLHIYEPRYKEMIGEAIRDESEFGVVLAREKGILNLGCTAIVTEVVTRYPDGRLDILTRGRRRFELLSLNEERSFLRGEVRFYEDTDLEVPPAALREAVTGAFEAARQFLGVPEGLAPDLTDPQLSFQLGQMINDLDFRQQLLASRSEIDRLRRLSSFLPEYAARQRYAEMVRAVAPRNGRAHGTVSE